MTTTDTNEGAEDGYMGDASEDDELPFAVKVMMLLIALAVLGVVLVDVLHFIGAI